MAEQIGTYHLAQHPELYSPARSNNFEFVITGIESLLRAGVDAADAEAGDYITGGQETIRLSVNKASVPHITQDEIVINRGNTKIYFAGVPTYGEGTLEVNDFIGADTKSVLMAWQRLSCDMRAETVGRAENYKKNCTLIEYTPDYRVVRYWYLEGCWIKGLSEPEFSHDDGGKRMITATIRYDRAIPGLPQEENA